MKKTEKPDTPRIPPEMDGIQVNFCKNPTCANFGVPASQENQKKGRRKGGGGEDGDTYTVSASGKDMPVLICKRCKESLPMKSNLGIAEELRRMFLPYQKTHVQVTCPNEGCENSKVSILLSLESYIPFGKTTAGNPRYRCKKCGRSFTVKQPRSAIDLQRHQKFKNFEIFEDLVARMPLRRLSFKHGISMETIYSKIAAFQKQFVAFAASRERNFENINFRDIDIEVDRQAYRLNWMAKSDKRNVILLGVASADKKSGYIFGHHLDYDSTVDSTQIKDDAETIGDLRLKPPFRRYARFWIRGDEPLPPKGEPEGVEGEDSKIIKLVKETYATAVVRGDIEIQQEDFTCRALPITKGLQIHSEYTLYAHFMYLKKLLPKFDKLVFYMDQESGIRAACHAAFCEDILSKRVDAFYVQIDKTLTRPQRERLVSKVRKDRDEYVSANPELEEANLVSIRQLQIERQLANRKKAGPWKDEWLEYPFPDMSEPSKAVAWLTDLGDRSMNNFELAELFLRASLHRVDNYFQLIRRMNSLLERAHVSSASGRRTYNSYDPYKPEVVQMLLDIFRTYYNYVKVGNDGETPAMRLGVAKAPISLEKILYFKETDPKLFFN